MSTFTTLCEDQFPVNPLGFLRPTKTRKRAAHGTLHVDIGPFASWREPYCMVHAAPLLSIQDETSPKHHAAATQPTSGPVPAMRT
tara:strand:- start:78 stop:332 length:255 start_codon:yes stop_codon:yes gene_type:complete